MWNSNCFNFVKILSVFVWSYFNEKTLIWMVLMFAKSKQKWEFIFIKSKIHVFYYYEEVFKCVSMACCIKVPTISSLNFHSSRFSHVSALNNFFSWIRMHILWINTTDLPNSKIIAINFAIKGDKNG